MGECLRTALAINAANSSLFILTAEHLALEAVASEAPVRFFPIALLLIRNWLRELRFYLS
jgi:hypothetical protein